MTDRNRTCPEYGGKLLPIEYGYPGPELMEAADKGEVILGGCEVEKGNPNWQCADCGKAQK